MLTQPLSLAQLMRTDVLNDPYPLYHALRETAPVYWDPMLHLWVVSGYEEAMYVLQHFSARTAPKTEQLAMFGLDELIPAIHLMQQQMLFMDAPEHTRVRALASKAFTPRRVEKMREHIQRIVNELLDKVAPAGRMDVIRDLANPLPSIVIAEMLGIPEMEITKLRQWSESYASFLGNFQLDPDRASDVMRNVNEMKAYFYQVMDEQRRHPQDGLISAMIEAEVDGSRFTDEEIMSNLVIVMVAGQETTTNLIGNGLLTLLRKPDQMALLKENPKLIPSAVEEMLRYESPGQVANRVPAEDTELNGKLIKAGQTTFVLVGGANRDPARFTDPDVFDATRPDNRHLGFGWGSHFCFGSSLARMETQVVFATLLDRIPDLTLADTEVHWRENLSIRGLTTLPVTFS